jgi:hypothetical protein
MMRRLTGWRIVLLRRLQRGGQANQLARFAFDRRARIR